MTDKGDPTPGAFDRFYGGRNINAVDPRLPVLWPGVVEIRRNGKTFRLRGPIHALVRINK